MNQTLELIIVKAGDRMANPQKENGYVPISNELIDQLSKVNLNGTQFKIILVVLRYTYGFNRKSWKLSTSFISEGTHCHVKQITRELKKLIDMNIISVNQNFKGTSSRILCLNKNYDQWNVNSSLVSTNQLGSELVTGNELADTRGSKLADTRGSELAPQLNTKYKYKDKYICAFDFDLLWKEYPKKKGKSAISKKSMKEIEKIGIDRMLKCINRYKEEISRNNTPEQYIMYGGTFFNGRYADYLEPEHEDSNTPTPEEIEMARRLRNQ